MKAKIINATYCLVIALSLFLSATSGVLAHVVVRPDTVGVGVRQLFSISVPNEMENPTTAIRLVLPDSLQSVTPNVKPGWRIEIKKSGTGDEAKVSEIVWTALQGGIPAEQRDDFYFQAQAPASETVIQWKAYQTYSDGTVVAWDQAVSGMSHEQMEEMEKQNKGPYSETNVVNDLKSNDSGMTMSYDMRATQNSTQNNLPLTLAGLAILLSAVSLWLQLKKR